ALSTQVTASVTACPAACSPCASARNGRTSPWLPQVWRPMRIVPAVASSVRAYFRRRSCRRPGASSRPESRPVFRRGGAACAPHGPADGERAKAGRNGPKARPAGGGDRCIAGALHEDGFRLTQAGVRGCRGGGGACGRARAGVGTTRRGRHPPPRRRPLPPRLQQLPQLGLVRLVQPLAALLVLQFVDALVDRLPVELGDGVEELRAPGLGVAGQVL